MAKMRVATIVTNRFAIFTVAALSRKVCLNSKIRIYVRNVAVPGP